MAFGFRKMATAVKKTRIDKYIIYVYIKREKEIEIDTLTDNNTFKISNLYTRVVLKCKSR
jgi:hypothetical protein